MSQRTMQGSNFVTRTGRTYYTGTPRSESQGNKCCCKVVTAIILVAIPAVLWSVENYQHQLEKAFDELESQVVEIDSEDMSTFPTSGSVPVYFTSNYTGSVADYDFGVNVDHALKLNRQTEYCQWQEFTTENCDTCKNSDGSTYKCHCTTTYHYQLGWRSHRIISAFFDQPFNHNNPQRDPFPSVNLASENAIAGEVHLVPDLLQNTRGDQRKVIFKHPGEAPSVPWYYRLFGWPDTNRYESVANLQPLLQSPAYLQHNFAYTGNDGWFFSPYEEGVAGGLLKKMGQFMEGSLFDWQLADFMPSCTAGDVRSRFHVVDPRDISVVGKFEPNPTAHIELVDNLASTDIHVGLVHAGAHPYGVCELLQCVCCDVWRCLPSCSCCLSCCYLSPRPIVSVQCA